MRIGINLLAVLPRFSGGIEFYIRNLLIALADIDTENQYYLFTNRDNHELFDAGRPNFQRIQVDTRARPQVSRIAWEQFYLPYLSARLHLDVLHSPTYTWPVLCNVPGVVTICDMLYQIYPETIDRGKLLFWRIFIPWSVKRCRKILTISERSKLDIVRGLPVTPDQVVVTPLALEVQFAHARPPAEEDVRRVCTKYGLCRPYILDVGGIGNHKNALTLVRALAVVRQKYPEMATLSLTITGNNYGAKEQILRAAEELKLSDLVFLPGYVAREDLPALYRGAVVYASPSYFEGFGLTLLEAMAFGIPVITSNCSSLPEVAGDAALIVDPDDSMQMAEAIHTLLANPEYRNKMISRGYCRVKAFSWEQTARLTLKAYHSAVEV